MIIKQFSKYFSIGILNTALHWSVFLFMHYVCYLSQSISNLTAFIIAVTFSFFMNAKFTFSQKATAGKFISYTVFLGGLSYLVGFISDQIELPAIVTLVVFSAISLICGFIYSKYIVFKGNK